VSEEHKTAHLLADVFVYAPIGAAASVVELLPKLARRGRKRVAIARVIGQVAVVKGQEKVGQLLDQLLDTPTAESNPTGTTTTAAPVAVPPDPEIEESIVVRRIRPNYDTDEAALLAIPDYDSLAASQVVPRLAGLEPDELEAVRRYEAAHRARRTILNRVAQLQQSA
jgi:hypothetical protein